jgi:diguanylate cyclase (GGDEF)-like protein
LKSQHEGPRSEQPALEDLKPSNQRRIDPGAWSSYSGGFGSSSRAGKGLNDLCKCFIFWFFALAFASHACAERVAFHNIFQHNKKLEHEVGEVNHITQDSQGFIWFGGQTGLVRFDGINTKIYRFDPNDPLGLPSDAISSLLVDGNGVLWIGTSAGLCNLDAEKERFNCAGSTSIESWPKGRVIALLLDQNKRLYIATTEGLYRSGTGNNFQRVPLDILANSASATISSLAVDKNNQIWIGTLEQGLVALDPVSGEQEYFEVDRDHASGESHYRILSLAVDQEDRLWVGTHGGGLNILSADRTHTDHYYYNEATPSAPASNVIWGIRPDSEGNVWLAVDNQAGLVRFNRQDGFISLRNDPYDSTSIGTNQVRTVYEDNNGDLWVGLFPSGVNFHNRATRQVQVYRHSPSDSRTISHSAILDIFKDSNGAIWLGTEDGLNNFDPETGSFTRYKEGLTAKAVLSIAQYDENTLWIGTWSGGLLAFDLTTKKFRPINTEGAGSDGNNSMFIWRIIRTQNSDMWLGTEFNGAGLFDRQLNEFSYIPGFHGNVNGPSLPHRFVRDIIEDSEGAIWFGTFAGLAILRPDPQNSNLQLRVITSSEGLLGKRLSALYEDSRGRIWVGTEDKDNFIFDPTIGKFLPLGVAQGLPPGLSEGFVEDQQGNIWILTTNGLVKVDGNTLAFQVFGQEHGLTGNSFNRNAALRDDNGYLYIGGAEGLNVFDPARVGADSPSFPVWVTAMRVMNQNVKLVEGKALTEKAISHTDRVQLGERQLMFAFDFVALDYRHIKDMRYAYRLEGFDNDWNNIGTHRTATYTNIAPGKYQFRVRATNGVSDWVQSKPIEIIITPALWKTWWAYVIYGTIFLIITYFGAHYYRLRGHTQIYKKLSSTDVLTGVANRAGLTQAANDYFHNQSRESLCIFFIDIDHFKKINDLRGHDSGDQVLIEVAETFKHCIRRSDLVGRWGGEEFMLMCPDVDQQAAMAIAEKIRKKVSENTYDIERSPLHVTVSLGLAMVGSDETFESAVHRSDMALYKAKRAGRNCVVLAD